MSDWISVEDRLPTDQKSYLICYGFLDKTGKLYSGRYIATSTYFAFDDPPHWQHEGTSGMKVTHWMPIEPPEGLGWV
jgi:hypothetical protein